MLILFSVVAICTFIVVRKSTIKALDVDGEVEVDENPAEDKSTTSEDTPFDVSSLFRNKGDEVNVESNQ